MANLTKEQVRQIITNAPQGTTPEGIVHALRTQGHTLEGMTDNMVGNSEKQNSSKRFSVGEFVKDIGVGVAKGGIETAQGLGQLTLKGAEKLTGKDLNSDETFFENENALEPQTPGEKVGKFGERVAEFAVPLSKVQQAVKAFPFVARLLGRAGTAGSVATAQEGELGKESIVAAGTEAAFPVVGGAVKKLVIQPVNRLVKSLASGLSGVTSESIEEIVKNPNVAREVSKRVDSGQARGVLTENASKIIQGVSQVRQQARKRFGQALETIRQVDIEPAIFRQNIQKTLDKYNVFSQSGKRTLQGVEFDDPKNIKKASELIDKLNNVKLDGVSLRKLADDIDNAKFKTATSDERLAFNAFIKDLSDSLKSSINQSTDKLKEANKQFSQEMQLAEGIEGIFGKVKFKSLNEIRKVSEKLETLFNKKGLSPDIIDDFLTRLGIEPSDFRTSEAVRQISETGVKSTTEGISVSEVIRALTSSVVTPKAVRDASIVTGIAENILTPILDKLSPTARATFIQLIVDGQNESTNTAIEPE